jgi:hypothetical protein
MKQKFIYIVGGFIVFSSLAKVLGSGFQTNRQALIAGVLTSVAFGLMLYEYYSEKSKT